MWSKISAGNASGGGDMVGESKLKEAPVVREDVSHLSLQSTKLNKNLHPVYTFQKKPNHSMQTLKRSSRHRPWHRNSLVRREFRTFESMQVMQH